MIRKSILISFVAGALSSIPIIIFTNTDIHLLFWSDVIISIILLHLIDSYIE